MSIIEILKIGFSGFAFLLAFLAYKLLSAEQSNRSPRKTQLNAIYCFMGFSIILGVITAITLFLPKLLEDKPNPLMQAMILSAKNRKPLPLDFIKEQIAAELTTTHNKRLGSLYLQREEEEQKLRNKINTDSDARKIESALRRIEKYIRQENRDYDSKVCCGLIFLYTSMSDILPK